MKRERFRNELASPSFELRPCWEDYRVGIRILGSDCDPAMRMFIMEVDSINLLNLAFSQEEVIGPEKKRK
ncbi:hypothetical protein Nmel_015652, partial [Mimus melanotis]